jgi:Flp pilus assembly protein TadB
MSSRHEARVSERSVPGIGGPGSVESAPDGQSALRLHAGIATIATILCAFVTGIFAWLGALVPAIVFGVIALCCLGILAWAVTRRRRAAPRP